MATQRETLVTRLEAYMAAELKILQKQEYTVGDGSTARRLRYADLPEVHAMIDQLTRQIATLDAQTSGARRVMYARPAN